jgi:hypothetical protein
MPAGKSRASVERTAHRLADGATLTPDPVIDAYKRDVDRSLLRERLRKTPAERVEDLVELARFAAELQRAGRRSGRR